MLILLWTACSKEDALTPSGEREDYFSVPENATGEEAELRRAFYAKYGVHLLFNDTLRHEPQGVYADGAPLWFTETIDFNYGLTDVTYTNDRYEYLQSLEDKKKAIEFTEDYILSHLGESIRPYSILLLKNDTYTSSGTTKVRNYRLGLRCLALNLDSVFCAKSEADYTKYCASILSSISLSKLQQNETHPTLEAFGAISDEYYYRDYDEFEEDFGDSYDPYYEAYDNFYYGDFYDWLDEYDLSYKYYSEAKKAYENGEIAEEVYAPLREAYEKFDAVYQQHYAYCKTIANKYGFLSVSTSGYFPSWPSYEWSSYLNAVFNTPEEQFVEEYSEYPLVREKYHLIKETLIDLGFKF